MDTTARVNDARFSGRWCRRYAAQFSAVDATFYTTARVNDVRFFSRWCGSCAVQLVAVSASLYTTVRVNAECLLLADDAGVMLPILHLLAPPFTLQLGQMLPVFRPLV